MPFKPNVDGKPLAHEFDTLAPPPSKTKADLEEVYARTRERGQGELAYITDADGAVIRIGDTVGVNDRFFAKIKSIRLYATGKVFVTLADVPRGEADQYEANQVRKQQEDIGPQEQDPDKAAYIAYLREWKDSKTIEEFKKDSDILSFREWQAEQAVVHKVHHLTLQLAKAKRETHRAEKALAEAQEQRRRRRRPSAPRSTEPCAATRSRRSRPSTRR